MSKQAKNPDELLRFLKTPSSYPHEPENVQHIQTHISHVFIASPYVYKIKKPVDFGFLDYSSLEKRKKYCYREVELNRRLTDDIYLGVVSIVKQGNSFQIREDIEDSPSDVEYAVKMKQLSEQYFLHFYLENDLLTRDHLDRVADKLADFYNGQNPREEILQWGAIENIRVNTDENFDQTEPFIGQTIEQNSFEAIRFFTNKYYERREALFEQRVREQRIVDGHGDLHLEHIHITPEKVQIYDCIEFNERFRYGDLAVDLAYLAMDLDFNNCWREERYFIDQMAQKLDDQNLHTIIDFYKCYRAYVKGKVKSLQSEEEEVPEQERKQAADLARKYFDLSLRYALLGSRPVVLVFMGRVGTGKSTLARHLEETLNLERFSSDCIRKKMAGLPPEQRSPASKREELYSRKMSEKTYNQLIENAVEYLQKGEAVILDATFSNKVSRQRMKEKLASRNRRFVFVETQAPDAVVKRRLKDREHQQKVISDARLEDFDNLNRRYQPPEEIAEEHLIRISTDQPVEDTLELLYRELIEMNL